LSATTPEFKGQISIIWNPLWMLKVLKDLQRARQTH
jgi:hypothetical protein